MLTVALTGLAIECVRGCDYICDANKQLASFARAWKDKSLKAKKKVNLI